MKQARDCGAAYVVILRHESVQTLHKFYSQREGLAVVLLLLFICYIPRALGRGVNARGCGIHCLSLHGQVARQAGTKGSGGLAGLYIFTAHWQVRRLALRSLLSGRSYPYVHNVMHSDLQLLSERFGRCLQSRAGIGVPYALAARNYCFTYRDMNGWAGRLSPFMERRSRAGGAPEALGTFSDIFRQKKTPPGEARNENEKSKQMVSAFFSVPGRRVQTG